MIGYESVCLIVQISVSIQLITRLWVGWFSPAKVFVAVAGREVSGLLLLRAVGQSSGVVGCHQNSNPIFEGSST